MQRIVWAVIVALMFSVVSIAQEETPEPDVVRDTLFAEDIRITAQRNAFDQVILTAEGQIVNQTASAHTDVSLIAEAYDATDTLIGEGFGFLVDACGTGVLPDFALQPDHVQAFNIPLELFEDGDVERVEVSITSTEIDPQPNDLPDTFSGITQATDQEVVMVEWLDGANLMRYAVGCDNDVFTNHDWYQYNAIRGDSTPIVHPDAERITSALLTQLGLEDPADYARSQLFFAPTSRRLLHQTDINVMISAEPDGSFRRLIYDNLARVSLQGIIWLPEGRFLAYYFGATGDSVRYFTASVEGQRISGSIYNTTQSQTVPGPTPDGVRVVLTGTFDEVTGYYLSSTMGINRELMFEAEPPGNNYPAPIYVDTPDGDFAYIVRPLEDGATHLQCFDFTTRQLNDLTALPLQLDIGSRAWTWLSPEGSTLALATDGINGGLWLIDLDTFGRCTPALAG